ncbi:MAG: hypothetical protein WCK51_01415 [Armatimonadota bacterium]
MSRVDTSIGFSLRSEPPTIDSTLSAEHADLSKFTAFELNRQFKMFGPVMIGILIAQILSDFIFEPYKHVADFLGKTILQIVVFAVMIGLVMLVILLGLRKKLNGIRAAGFDSPVVHLTAEGQWITFGFASGREFVDRWDRLLRFKSADNFTEFEFPANPPIIIPTSAIPEDTQATITAFCAAEKIPSETKR